MSSRGERSALEATQEENSGQPIPYDSPAPPKSMDALGEDWVKAIEVKDCKHLMDILSDFGGYRFWSVKGRESRTALHVAAMQGCFQLAEQLVDCFLVMCLRNLQENDLFKLVERPEINIGTMPMKELIAAMDGASRDRSALDKARKAIGNFSLAHLRELFKEVGNKGVEEEEKTLKDMIEAQDGRSGITALDMAEKFTGNRSITQYLKRVLSILKDNVDSPSLFYEGIPGTDWYRALELKDCSTLEVLLQINPRLLLETLPGNVTVLHVAVLENNKNLVNQVLDVFKSEEAVVWEAAYGYSPSLQLQMMLEVKASQTKIIGSAKTLKCKAEWTALELANKGIGISHTEFAECLEMVRNGGPEDSRSLLTQLRKFIGDPWREPAHANWDVEFEKDVDYNFELQPRLDILRFHFACKHPTMYTFIEGVFSSFHEEKLALFELQGLCMFQDGQGRTPFHTWVQYLNGKNDLPRLIWNSDQIFNCFTKVHDGRGRLALQRAIMMQYSERHAFKSFLAQIVEMDFLFQRSICPSKVMVKYDVPQYFEYLELAILLGQTNVVERVLNSDWKVDWKEFNSPNLSQKYNCLSSPLLLTALVGNQAILRLLLQKPVDPMVVDDEGRTSLHYAVADESNLMELLARKNSNFCISVDDLIQMKDKRMQAKKPEYYVGKQACINMLIQAGVDLWQVDKAKRIPDPDPNASASFQVWWHEKLATDTTASKNSFNQAGNALAVVGALVAATSYIGPLQPPMNYTDSGYVHMSVMAVQIFMVSNTLAFYLATASVMFAVVPSLPMPQESVLDELRRARYMVASSLFVLLLSIVCVIVSFGAASVVVIKNDHSFNPLDLLFWPTIIGGLFCVIAILSFFIRLMRLVFYRSCSIRKIYQFSIWKLCRENTCNVVMCMRRFMGYIPDNKDYCNSG